ncbi:DUF2799 domain-containing protein [Brevundimonas sp.]
MVIRTLILAGVAGAATLALGSCATMSEDQCLAGAWGERGYKDGLEGLVQTRLADHAEACAKYGVVPETEIYMSAREDGLRSYCTLSGGFQAGRQGRSYAGVCPAFAEEDFIPAYEDGRRVYAVEQAIASAETNLSSAVAYIDDREDKLEAKRDELGQEGLTDEQRQKIRERIEEVRGEIRDARRRARDAEDALRYARDEADRLRFSIGSRYGGW